MYASSKGSLFKLSNTLSVFSMEPISYCNFTEFNINCPLKWDNSLNIIILIKF